MRTGIRCVVATLVLAALARPAPALTVAEFEALEKRARQGDADARATIGQYMAGVANTLAVIRQRQVNGAGALVCAPAGVPLNAQEVGARYREFLQSHPHVYDVQHEVLVPEIVLAGYHARYCGGGAAAEPMPAPPGAQ